MSAADGVLDLALCMSVNPGWGNQTLIPHSLREAAADCARSLADEVALEVDGGVHAADGQQRARQAGANLLVAGSAVFGAADPGAAFTAAGRRGLA